MKTVNTINKPKSTFQTQLTLLQSLVKHPSRSKTPPNLIPTASRGYVNTTVNYDSESEEIDKFVENEPNSMNETKKNKGFKSHTECNSNSSRRITSLNLKKTNNKKKDDILRFSLENNKNLAWNDISKLLNNTNKKEVRKNTNSNEITFNNILQHTNQSINQNEPKCMRNNLVKPKINFEKVQISLPNKGNLLRKSLNYREDIENIPVVHEKFENMINTYANNQKNLELKNQNIRHSYEGLSSIIVKTEENEKIKSLNGKFVNFIQSHF